MVFGTAKGVLFIEVSSFQGVLIRGVPLWRGGTVSLEMEGEGGSHFQQRST